MPLKIVWDEGRYLEAAERFLGRMLSIQRGDGGFGPEDYSIPDAGGSVLLELLAAHACKSELNVEEAIGRAVQYVLALQVKRRGDAADGAFHGLTGQYTLDPSIANIRSGAYAILALLRFAGATGPIYFCGAPARI